MGKKTDWIAAVKKVLSPQSKEKKDKKGNKSKKWFQNPPYEEPELPHEEPIAALVETLSALPAPSTPNSWPPPEELKLTDKEEEQNNSCSVALATQAEAEAEAEADAAAAAEAEVEAEPEAEAEAADEAAAEAEIVCLTIDTRYSGKLNEEVAAIKIQTAFRGNLARRALRALRGLARLKSIIDGPAAKRQATVTLRSMQTLARVQSQIRSRRMKMLEDNQALLRDLQEKRERELAKAAMAEEWDDSVQSREQMEAKLLNKQDAAMRRERALAYAFARQQMWKNSPRPTNPTFMDPNNPHWGWSWLERWMAARPWESRSMTTKEFDDNSSVKSVSPSVGGEITKAYARRELSAEKPSPTAQKSSRPPSRQSPSTRPSAFSLAAGKLKQMSPRGNVLIQDDDSKSMLSMQSERPRRHSIAGSLGRDDESLASSPSVPSYMAPTRSARARARSNSTSGMEDNGNSESGLAGSTKKRLSFSTSPGGLRRHSGTPKLDSISIKGSGKKTERAASNGWVR